MEERSELSTAARIFIGGGVFVLIILLLIWHMGPGGFGAFLGTITVKPGLWIAAIFTLCIFSFLYRDNPLYRLAEHIVVGISAGYGFVIIWENAFMPKLWLPLKQGVFSLCLKLGIAQAETWLADAKLEPDLSRLIIFLPALLGLMYVCRLIKKLAWLSRFPIAFLIGTSSGVAIPLMLKAYILKQVQATMIDLTAGGAWVIICNSVLVVGVLAALIYFFFSVEHKGVFGGVAKLGILFFMIGFGATFGYTVMARLSLLIGRLYFLLHDWIGVV